MTELGVNFPAHTGPLQDLIRYVKTAEDIGFDMMQIPDNLGFADPFCVLAIIAKETNRIKLSLITNPYSRNPALIARSAATVNEISNGRLKLGLCAGGSWTLRPLNIPMWDRPIRTMKETIEIVRRLIRGDAVDYEGEVFKLRDAKLLFTPIRKSLPIVIAGRGPQMLRLAGKMVDGVLFGSIPAPYFDFGVKQIEKGARKAGRSPDEVKVYAGVSFVKAPREEFEKFLRWRVANVLLDTPSYVLEKSQIEPDTMERIKRIKHCKDVLEATKFVTEDVAKLYSYVNTTEACIEKAKELVKKGIKQIGVTVPPGKEDRLYPIVRDEIIPVLKAL
jgi:5,10-methylenetetrahydromethanopterin reductase